MKKQILSEELKRMHKLAGLINESEIGEGIYGRGSYDPWADIETGGEYSKSKERVSASYKRQKEEDSLGSTSYQSFTNKIKRLGPLMTDDEAIEMMDDMKRMLSHDEIVDVYNFMDRNNISSPIYTYLDQYKGETRSYGNYGLGESDTKKVIDLSKYDSHILDQLRQKFARTYGDMPSDEELKNIISAMPELNKEGALEESELLKEETIEDFFEFLGKNPGKSSVATVMYTNPVKVNKFIIDDLGNKVPNPMFDKLFKNTRFMFRWQDTYNRAVERNNPEHEFGKRSGTFEKVEGVDVLERGKSGLYLPIIPTGSESAYSVYENGKFSPISKEEARKYMPEYKEREGGSGVDFRPLIVDRISKINAGGNNWINPNFQYEYLGPERMAEDVMIKEGQLGRAITKMLIEEMLKEGVGPFASNAPRGPYGVNRYQIGHPDYEKDMEKLKADREEEEKRKQEDLKSYGTPIYDPQTGRGWTPETLTTYVKKKYDVDVPEEVYSKSDPNKPWMAIKNIQDYLADLSKK